MDRNHVWKILTKEVESVIVHPLVEIVGMGRVLIEHHNGIIDYQPEYICVRMDYGTLKICGKNLHFVKICAQQLVIAGEISAVCMARR